MNNEPNFEGEEMKMPEQKKVAEPEEKENAIKETKGAFIVLLFVALGLILVGIFYWYTLSSVPPSDDMNNSIRPTSEMNKEPETTNAVAEVDSFGALSTSDEITAIEADLESTNLGELETELLQIDAELESSVQ